MAVTILLADDHDVIREGIKSVLSQEADYDVVGEARDGEETVEKVEKLSPDIVLLDITMPKKSGLDILRKLNNVSPHTKIVILTMHRSPIYLNKALSLGVKGYLHKENVVDDLLPALRCVCRNETYLASKITTSLVETMKPGQEPGGIQLTERESDILRLVVDGKSAREIAEVLCISPRTVENYKNNMLKKLGLSKTSELIKYALKHKIVETED